MNPFKNRKIAGITAIFCTLCFMVVAVSVYRVGIIRGLNAEVDEMKDDAKIQIQEHEIVEGVFVDRNNIEITSYSEPGKAAELQFPESFSYMIGYNSSRLGVSGLRKKLYSYLFDGGKDKIGGTVKLTVDSSLQEQAYHLLDKTVGSVCVVNADTGEILTMASRSNALLGFNANKIDSKFREFEGNTYYYSDLYNSYDGFWFDRAVFAEDPPGSCAKIITATSLVENGLSDFTYVDTGFECNDMIHNYDFGEYGECNLEKALNHSINTYFAKAGMTLGNGKLKKTYGNFMVGIPIELDFTTLESTYMKTDAYSELTLASNAFGQGQLVMTPLHLAMTASAIMKDGKMMKPYLIDSVVNDKKSKYKGSSEKLSDATDRKTAEAVKELLHSNAKHYGLYDFFDEDEVYLTAKTGTAETSNGHGDHLYYTFGVEYKGKRYGVCIDQAQAAGTGSQLKEKVVELIQYIINLNKA